MLKKIKWLMVFAIVMFNFGVTTECFAEQKENEETIRKEIKDIDMEFIKDSIIELSEDGNIIMKYNDIIEKNRNMDRDKSSIVVVCVPNTTEDLSIAMKRIKEIKENKITKETEKFLTSFEEEKISTYSNSSTSKEDSLWNVVAKLTIDYSEDKVNGKDAVLLKSVGLSITTPSTAHVDSVSLTYGCSGFTENGSKSQSRNKEYGKISASSRLNDTITCPSSWDYVYIEDVFTTVGANITVNITKRSSGSTTSSTKLKITNNIYE